MICVDGDVDNMYNNYNKVSPSIGIRQTINRKLITVLPFLGEFPKSGVSGGKLGKEFGPLGIPQHAQILPQSWGILMKIGERKLEINPLLHVKFGQHFVVYSQ